MTAEERPARSRPAALQQWNYKRHTGATPAPRSCCHYKGDDNQWPPEIQSSGPRLLELPGWTLAGAMPGYSLPAAVPRAKPDTGKRLWTRLDKRPWDRFQNPSLLSPAVVVGRTTLWDFCHVSIRIAGVPCTALMDTRSTMTLVWPDIYQQAAGRQQACLEPTTVQPHTAIREQAALRGKGL